MVRFLVSIIGAVFFSFIFIIANLEIGNLNHYFPGRLAKYDKFGMESGYSLATLPVSPPVKGGDTNLGKTL
jgi:hypothetical protein